MIELIFIAFLINKLIYFVNVNDYSKNDNKKISIVISKFNQLEIDYYKLLLNTRFVDMVAKKMKKYLVPLIDQLSLYQKKELQLQEIMYFDEKIIFSDGNERINYDLDTFLKLMGKEMKKTNYKSWKLFIFIKKYKGNYSSITSINHEFGHCMQLYYSKSKNI